MFRTVSTVLVKGIQLLVVMKIKIKNGPHLYSKAQECSMEMTRSSLNSLICFLELEADRESGFGSSKQS